MCDLLTFGILREMLCDIADTMSANANLLTQLDTAIGDGDHGRNMELGFASVRQELEMLPPTTTGILLRSVGMTLVATVGGASGRGFYRGRHYGRLEKCAYAGRPCADDTGRH